MRGFLDLQTAHLQGPPCVHQLKGRATMHAPWGCTVRGLHIPRSQGCTELSHPPMLRSKALPWHRHGPTPALTWHSPGLVPPSMLPGKHGCQGALPRCSLDGATLFWTTGEFTHSHHLAPASVNAALFSWFVSIAKQHFEVNSTF